MAVWILRSCALCSRSMASSINIFGMLVGVCVAFGVGDWKTDGEFNCSFSGESEARVCLASICSTGDADSVGSEGLVVDGDHEHVDFLDLAFLVLFCKSSSLV